MEAARKLYEFETYEAYEEYLNKTKHNLVKDRIRTEKTKEVTKKSGVFMYRSMVYAGIFLAIVALVLFRYAIIFEAQFDNNEMKKEIAQMEIQLSEMKSELDSIVVLENVEKVAIQELGMTYPERSQTVYINKKWNYQLDRLTARVYNSSKPKKFSFNHQVLASVKIISGVFDKR